jgi:hypothetical protein
MPHDDGRRYALTGPRGIGPLRDNLRPHAEQHTITVHGSAELARQLAEAEQAGVCVAWRDITDEHPTRTDDDTDGM